MGETLSIIAGFRFAEFEVTAEVSAEGKLSLLGLGSEVRRVLDYNSFPHI